MNGWLSQVAGEPPVPKPRLSSDEADEALETLKKEHAEQVETAERTIEHKDKVLRAFHEVEGMLQKQRRQ